MKWDCVSVRLSVQLSIYLPTAHAVYRKNIRGFSYNCYMLLVFTMVCSILKLNYIDLYFVYCMLRNIYYITVYGKSGYFSDVTRFQTD